VQWIYQLNRALVVRGEKVILDDITLSFLPGAKIGVLGPNGAGKSTLLRVMAGVEQTSNGDAQPAPNISVGLLPQEPVLDESKTCPRVTVSALPRSSPASSSAFITTGTPPTRSTSLMT
jgi:ATPase subunit of ABC transporter with duplicated ATPase domains